MVTARGAPVPWIDVEWHDEFVAGATRGAGREIGRLEFGPTDLNRVREFVRLVTSEHLPDRAGDAVLAVHEVAVNSVLHGGGSGVVHVDAMPDGLVFTVEDTDGTGKVPAIQRPGAFETSGRGLWIAQRLCDDLSIEVRPSRTCVRLRLGVGAGSGT
jgi:anti-sigma regulatory factor (Ser/Thr protein kinase)